MEHAPQDHDSALRNEARSSARLRGVILGSLLAGPMFLATVAVARLLLRSHQAAVLVPQMAIGLLLVGLVLAVGMGLAHHVKYWRRPAKKLEEVIPLIRAGEVPIDELSRIEGSLQGLVLQVQELLCELRQQRSQMARADQEMRQRIAQRTSALERLIGSLQQQANRDALTGLYNRRMFDQHLATVFDQARSAGHDPCLIILDLDHFKLLNDTLGHVAGDEFLRSVGQLIRSTIRQQDLAFRHGGDEFVVVLPDASRSAGQVLTKRLVSLIDALGKTLKLSTPPGVSAGLISASEMPDPTIASLLQIADQRLYANKQLRKLRPRSAA